LRENSPECGAVVSALAVAAKEGLRAAEPLWREVRCLTPDGEDTEVGRMVTGYMRGDGAEADMWVSRILSAPRDWEDLADAADRLAFLAGCPDADPAFFGPRLSRVIAARDAFQARCAE
jgi:hypothetical protein